MTADQALEIMEFLEMQAASLVSPTCPGGANYVLWKENERDAVWPILQVLDYPDTGRSYSIHGLWFNREQALAVLACFPLKGE